MPTHTRYDHAARLAVLEARGEVSPQEAVEQFRAVCAELADLHARDPQHQYGVLVDTRGSATVPTPENIFHLLREMTAIPASRRPCRWAIVATAPAQYGMGRLFQAHAEDRQIEIQVFKLYDEALAWLSADR